MPPNSKKPKKSLAPSELDIFRAEFGASAKCPRVYIRTFGCQMGAVLYDYRAVFGEDLVAKKLMLPRNSVEGCVDR